MRCKFSGKAAADLEEIGDYIALDSKEKAIEFIDKINKYCLDIAKSPNAAPLRENLGIGVRMVVFSRYLIFYTVCDDFIRIARILHSARDISSDFFIDN